MGDRVRLWRGGGVGERGRWGVREGEEGVSEGEGGVVIVGRE